MTETQHWTRDDVIGWVIVIASICAIAALAWFYSVISARAETVSGQYRLEWQFVTVTERGLDGGKSPERQVFANAADCGAFGVLHAKRMEDWIRGLIRADWNHPVRVAFDCSPVGDPT